MYNPSAIFQFAADSPGRVALVTIAGVSGPSARSAGAHLAVREDGAFAGSLSGGCIEAAIAAQARRAIADGAPREARFGAGSPYLDIRLPCGGALDVLINVIDAALGARVLRELRQRRAVRLILPRRDGAIKIAAGDPESSARQTDDALEVNHTPPLRLAVFGHGGAVEALAALARAIEAEIVVGSPDDGLLSRLRLAGVEALAIEGRGLPTGFVADPWTAGVLFFHDHAFEPHLLRALLSGPAFYVGAMGSRKTHDARRQTLRDLGLDEAAIARIAAPIGLIPSMRDPETLAISVLAEVAARFNLLYLRRDIARPRLDGLEGISS
jgi:xanthine dehydrogenase accessory factor